MRRAQIAPLFERCSTVDVWRHGAGDRGIVCSRRTAARTDGRRRDGQRRPTSLRMLADVAASAALHFDIIHSHLDLLSLPLAGLAGTPLVVTLHGRLDIASAPQEPHRPPAGTQRSASTIVATGTSSDHTCEELGDHLRAQMVDPIPNDGEGAAAARALFGGPLAPNARCGRRHRKRHVHRTTSGESANNADDPGPPRPATAGSVATASSMAQRSFWHPRALVVSRSSLMATPAAPGYTDDHLYCQGAHAEGPRARPRLVTRARRHDRAAAPDPSPRSSRRRRRTS
jgi:hypothetical protein